MQASHSSDRAASAANNAGPRRILLVKTSSLGDVVHNLPVASALHASFPAAAIDWVVEEALADLPRLHPAVVRVVPVALRRWRKKLFAAQTWREMAEFRRQLRGESYDLVLDSQGLIKSALIARQAVLTARGERVGYAAEAARESLAARGYDRGIGIPRNLHAVLRNRWLAAAACDQIPDEDIDYGIRAGALTAAWLPPAPYALLFASSSREDKSWSPQAWRELAASLTARGLSLVLPAGTDAERRAAASLAAAMGERALAAPPLALAQIASLCAGASLVVGVDTGLTHLAAALGRPTLCLFAGSDPALTGVFAATGAPHAALNLGRAKEPPSAAEAGAAAEKLLAGGAG